MTCPFLKEAQVKSCRASAVRKLIPLAETGRADEKCASEAYVSCATYRASALPQEMGPVCPYLTESLMQYCGAAPVAKFVPYSESLLSRCGNDSFRYCELYLAIAHPELPAEEIDGVRMPARLQYSANHMWLDAGEGGMCHAGIDAFLSRVLGKVDRVGYVSGKGRQRPSAVLSASGVDLEVVFPNSMELENCNLHLRADPSRITSEPYTRGWLFEGRPDAETTRGLRQGAEAHAWMEQEVRRMTEYLQQRENTVADGGAFVPGVIHQLERERRPALMREFFSFYRSREKDEYTCAAR